MRRIFWQVMTSLDGFMEGPGRELDWHVTGGDFGRYVAETLDSIDAILLGRRTYDVLASYWPTSSDPEAARMNALEKVVFSRTLREARWQNTRIVSDVAPEVAALKRRPGRDLAVFGSTNLVSTLMRLDAVDEYRIFVNPVVLGGGAPAFERGFDRRAFRLTGTRALGSGVVVLTYAPA